MGTVWSQGKVQVVVVRIGPYPNHEGEYQGRCEEEASAPESHLDVRGCVEERKCQNLHAVHSARARSNIGHHLIRTTWCRGTATMLLHALLLSLAFAALAPGVIPQASFWSSPAVSKYQQCNTSVTIPTSVGNTLFQPCASPYDVVFDPCYSLVFISCGGSGVYYRGVDAVSMLAIAPSWYSLTGISVPAARYMDVDTTRGLLYIADNTNGVQAVNLSTVVAGSAASSFSVFNISSTNCAPSVPVYDVVYNVLYSLCFTSNGSPAPVGVVSVASPHLGVNGPRQSALLGVCEQAQWLELFANNSFLMVGCAGLGNSPTFFMLALDHVGGMSLVASYSASPSLLGGNCYYIKGFSFYNLTSSPTGPYTLYVNCHDSGGGNHPAQATLTGTTSAATMSAVESTTQTAVGCSGDAVAHYDQYTGSMSTSCVQTGSTYEFYDLTPASTGFAASNGHAAQGSVFDHLGRLWRVDTSNVLVSQVVCAGGYTRNLTGVCPPTAPAPPVASLSTGTPWYEWYAGSSCVGTPTQTAHFTPGVTFTPTGSITCLRLQFVGTTQFQVDYWNSGCQVDQSGYQVAASTESCYGLSTFYMGSQYRIVVHYYGDLPGTTTVPPTTATPTTATPTTAPNTTAPPTTAPNTTQVPTTAPATTAPNTTQAPTTPNATTQAPTTTQVPTTAPATTATPTTTTQAPTTPNATTQVPTTAPATTQAPTTTAEATTQEPSTVEATTLVPSTTAAPSIANATDTAAWYMTPAIIAPVAVGAVAAVGAVGYAGWWAWAHFGYKALATVVPVA
jgi:hypothetical protein